MLKEAGVVAAAREVSGFRNSASRPGRPNANLYVIFRLELVSGEPRGDDVGTLDADVFSLAELEKKAGKKSRRLVDRGSEHTCRMPVCETAAAHPWLGDAYAITSDAMTRPRSVSSSRCQRRSNPAC